MLWPPLATSLPLLLLLLLPLLRLLLQLLQPLLSPLHLQFLPVEHRRFVDAPNR